jgi:LCP family protein required for cell wall assembly
MIASVNKSTGIITVCSILRDTHLYIPGEREAKVNAAYAWGGANLLVQTIEQNFGIKIDDYATVNFEMFTALVDGLGGVDVEVTENEADYINNRHNYKKETKPDHFESGESVHLNGYQALWYARIRKLDSDFMRTYRQRKVITAIAENVKKELLTGNIFGLISTAKDVAPNIETSLSKSEFTSLILSMVSCVSKTGLEMDKLLVSQQLPFEDTWWFESKWDGSSIAIDFSENREMLYNSIYEPVIEEETEEDTTNE